MRARGGSSDGRLSGNQLLSTEELGCAYEALNHPSHHSGMSTPPSTSQGRAFEMAMQDWVLHQENEGRYELKAGLLQQPCLDSQAHKIPCIPRDEAGQTGQSEVQEQGWGRLSREYMAC